MSQSPRDGAPVLQQTPVAFLIFNRPAFTARVFAAIAKARPSRLLVVGDGPRPDHPEDEHLVAEARAVIEQVDWACEVLTCYSEVNLGCRRRVASGLDWVFSNVEEAIILEDDCLPEPSFFSYCEQLLSRYREDQRVQMISGCNVLPPERSGSYSYYFSRCYHVWGWATWAKAWSNYDIDMRRWPELRETSWLQRHLGGKTEARIARAIFDRAYAGEVDTWDFPWVFAGWSRDAAAIVPTVNLVTNIGYGEAASHERNANHPLANLPTSPINFPLVHPPRVEVLEAADKAEWVFVYPTYFQSRRARVFGRILNAARAG